MKSARGLGHSTTWRNIHKPLCRYWLLRGILGVVRRGLTRILLLLAAFVARADSTSEKHFTEKVKPLLDSRCVSCHGADKVKAGLRLDSRAGALKGGDSGPALVPGKPDDSLLLQAVMHSKKDLEMPPKEKLTTNDIAVLRRWIEDGAPWPSIPQTASIATEASSTNRIGDAWSDPRNPIVRIFGGQRLDVWSLKPIKHLALPAPAAGATPASPKSGSLRKGSMSWVPGRNGIDQFVRARLFEKGIAPSREAPKRELARRLYFDLTGLPPSPAEMKEYLNDTSSDAYEQLVDRLLQSPRYGEHWARQWMDVIRYSDSNGFDWDEYRPRAWRFRDYLIRSFNDDKPFDQFIREHLAGDELVQGEPGNEWERDCLIATGYLRVGPQDNSAALFNEQGRARAEYMADLTETTASAFMGLTIGCARCHDHKFDPISQADHYRLRAFFEPIKYSDDLPIDLSPEQKSIREHNQRLEAKMAPLKSEKEELTAAVKKKLRDEKLGKLSAEERALIDIPKDKRSEEQKTSAQAAEKKLELKDKEITAAFSPDEKKRSEELIGQIEKLAKEKRSYTFGLLATDNAEKIPVTKILYQGDYKAEREAVKPGFLSMLDPNPAPAAKPTNPKTTGRRLALANWIASTNNPLTARVFVNRMWQSHFGRGLVETPNDFGLAGSRPTNPELLDWLAVEFMRSGWSIKSLHKLIVTSSTYRQASTARADAVKVDANNTLLWRQNLRRLSAEQLRDSMLAVSGLLKTERSSGPPIWPDLPADILQANPAFLDDNAEKTKGWYPSPKTNQNVRSVFLVQKRTVRAPFLETFDMPENSVSCPKRTESIVAPQALTLLNGTIALESARALAAQIKTNAGDDQKRQIEELFSAALQRPPDSNESRRCADLLQRRSLTELCRAILNLNEFVFVD